MQRTGPRYLAVGNVVTAALLSCAPHAGSPRVETARGAPAAGDSAPKAATGTLTVTQLFAPGSLHAIPQKSLVDEPDVWDPTGTLVGHLATCEVWETATGLYRGALPPSVCAGWKRQETR